MKEASKPLNKRISTYRKLAGYTQQTAADALGIKKTTYARMELHGNPTPDMLVKIAKLYNVSPMLLLFGIDSNRFEDSKPDDPPMRLSDNNINLFRPTTVTEITLTVNEKNCIKICRKLSKEQRSEVMDFINKLYNSNNKKG
ncbi:MAG: helix-turn-helix domain-containing protein [Clostridia bacterium]|nr:helix-turn-helix domain-containing protein [Clostridia bacterium]